MTVADDMIHRSDGRALHDEVYGVVRERERFRMEGFVSYLSFSLMTVNLLWFLHIIDCFANATLLTGQS